MTLISQSEDEGLDQVSRAAITGSPAFRRFLAWLLLPPFFLYLLMFMLVLVPALRFERWGPSEWGPILQFGFDARTDADILIFGDSSAFLGVDPRLINTELGVRSVVLPNTVGSLPITGELSLRRYLATNQPPKLLVLYFTAWDLDFQHTAQSRVFFEGEEMLLHNGTPSNILRFAKAHPLELLAFPFRLNSTIGVHLLRTMLRHEDREQQTAAALGHAAYAQPYPPLAAPCTLPSRFLQQENDAAVRSLIERFSTPQTRVLVYLAPIPDCSGASVFRDRATSMTRPEPPALLPPSWFASDLLYAHPVPGAVPHTTATFIAFLHRHADLFSAPMSLPPSQADHHLPPPPSTLVK